MSLPLQPAGNVYNAGANPGQVLANPVTHPNCHTHTHKPLWHNIPEEGFQANAFYPPNSAACIIVIL